MADQQGSSAVTVKQEARAGLTPKEALQDHLESAEYVEQRAQSGVNGAGNVPLKHEQTSVGDAPEDRRKRRQAATTFERKYVKAPHARPCDDCGDLSPFSIGAVYWEEPYDGGQQAKLCKACFNTKFPGFGARNFQCKKVFGEHTRPCGTCGSCEPFTPYATFYEEPCDIGKQRKLCRTCFIAEFPGYASKCAPAYRSTWLSNFGMYDWMMDDGVEDEYDDEYEQDYDEEGEYDEGDVEGPSVQGNEEGEQKEEDGSFESAREEGTGSEEEHECVGPITAENCLRRPIEATQEDAIAEGPVNKRLRSGI